MCTQQQVKVLEYKIPLPNTIPGLEISYSDHEAISTKLLIQTKSKSAEKISTCATKLAEVKASGYADTLGEGIEVLDQILKRLSSDKNSYFVGFIRIIKDIRDFFLRYLLNSLRNINVPFQVMALLLIIPLFFLIDAYPPFGMGMLYLVTKMFFSGVIIFFIFMGTMWNSIERNGILSTKLSMEMARTAMAHYDNRPFLNDQ